MHDLATQHTLATFSVHPDQPHVHSEDGWVHRLCQHVCGHVLGPHILQIYLSTLDPLPHKGSLGQNVLASAMVHRIRSQGLSRLAFNEESHSLPILLLVYPIHLPLELAQEGGLLCSLSQPHIRKRTSAHRCTPKILATPLKSSLGRNEHVASTTPPSLRVRGMAGIDISLDVC